MIVYQPAITEIMIDHLMAGSCFDALIDDTSEISYKNAFAAIFVASC